MLNFDTIQAYRARTFRTAPGLRVTDRSQAVDYVNERGFIYFWPIKDVTLPSLWTAAAGDRPVADAHDDPGHKTWGWKDEMLGKRAWYYGKVLRKKATIISLEMLPYFYALSENYGSPEEDYLTLYEQGRMAQETRLVYETVLQEGPIDTVALRKATRLTSRESDSRFNRALVDLQANFQITPVGVAKAGRWKYAFNYDVTTRHFPDLIERTRFIDERQARSRLAETAICSLGAVTLRDLVRLFGWTQREVEQTLERLAQAGVVRCKLDVDGQPGSWYALAELAGQET